MNKKSSLTENGQDQHSYNSSRRSKPFCDCERCECDNCPDILRNLGISLNKSKNGFRENSEDNEKQSTERRPSILDMLSPDRDCDCEIMARAIRSDIHRNMGLPHRQTRISNTSEQTPTNSKDANKNTLLATTTNHRNQH